MPRSFLYDLEVDQGLVQAFSLDTLAADDLPRPDPSPAGGYGPIFTLTVDQYGRVIAVADATDVSVTWTAPQTISVNRQQVNLTLAHPVSFGAVGVNPYIICTDTTSTTVFQVWHTGRVVATAFEGDGSPLTALNADELTTGTAALARGGTGADLSATGPGLVYQAAAGDPLTVVQSVVGVYLVTADATNHIPLSLKSHASGAAADLFQIRRGSDNAVGVRAPSEFSLQVRNNLIVGGNGAQTDDGNPRFWFYDGGTNGRILFSAAFVLLASDVPLNWDNGAAISGSPNVGLIKDSAGVLRVSNASTGRGGLLAATLGLWAGGSTAKTATAGGVIFDHYADAGNVGTGEDDLVSDSVPASTLGANGDKLTAQYALTFVTSATATRQVRVYFGGTAILDTGALTFSSAGSADVYVTIIRESSTVVRCVAEIVVSGLSLQPIATYTRITGLTLSNANTLKITGEAAGVGAATDDVVCRFATVEWKPAAL